MKITKIKVGYGRTYNLGNYQSRRIDCELEAEMDTKDDRQACTEELFEIAKQNVAEQQVQVEAEAKQEKKKRSTAEMW